jgi:uncharacterized membrane protein
MTTVTRNIISGVLAIIPLAVTIWVIWFLVDLLVGAGRPIVWGLARALWRTSPQLSQLLIAGWFQSAVALIVALGLLYLLGWAANAVVGRRLLLWMNRTMERVPLASTIYRATRTLVEALRGTGLQQAQQIVLIEFPMSGRRAVGIVTRIFPATTDRPQLAAVYVPTTPNPTSGFVQIIPTEQLVWLDWSKDDAMAFIVSGGATAPDALPSAITWSC